MYVKSKIHAWYLPPIKNFRGGDKNIFKGKSLINNKTFFYKLLGWNPVLYLQGKAIIERLGKTERKKIQNKGKSEKE